MDLAEARRRIRERANLNAFISISDEAGSGTVVAVNTWFTESYGLT